VSYLQEIARLSERNVGGLLKIQVARIADIVSFPDPVDGVLYGDIEFAEGKGFSTWCSISQTARLSSENRSSQEGNLRVNRLPFTIARDKVEIKQQFVQAERDEFIVLFMDGNGRAKIFGSPYQPVRFEFSHSSGDAHSSRNQYDCAFFYSGPENVFFYDGSVATPPAGGSPVIIRWNDGESVQTIASALPGQVVTINSAFIYDDFDITEDVT
jgi:hypothetical protein